MEQQELIAIATKLREGKASREEIKVFFTEFEDRVTDLNRYLKTLPVKRSKI